MIKNAHSLLSILDGRKKISSRSYAQNWIAAYQVCEIILCCCGDVTLAYTFNVITGPAHHDVFRPSPNLHHHHCQNTLPSVNANNNKLLFVCVCSNQANDMSMQF